MSEIKTFHHGVKTSKACVALLVAVSVLAQTGRGTDYVRLKGDDGSGSSAFFSNRTSPVSFSIRIAEGAATLNAGPSARAAGAASRNRTRIRLTIRFMAPSIAERIGSVRSL